MPSRMFTEAAIRSAEPREKAYKLFDSGGLFVLINPEGSRWWRFKYRYGGTERGISFGVHPLTTHKLARQRRDDAKRLLSDGIDPSHHRRAQKLSQAMTFEMVACEWLELQSNKLGLMTIEKARWARSRRS